MKILSNKEFLRLLTLAASAADSVELIKMLGCTIFKERVISNEFKKELIAKNAEIKRLTALLTPVTVATANSSPVNAGLNDWLLKQVENTNERRAYARKHGSSILIGFLTDGDIIVDGTALKPNKEKEKNS